MTEFEKQFHDAVKPMEAWIDAEPRKCLSCKRPYAEHSTALDCRSDKDDDDVWYTVVGERCPTKPNNQGALYRDPDVWT